MHSILNSGVIYIEDFDDPPPESATRGNNITEIVAPTFSAEELEEARQQAYAEGARAGQMAATQERAHATRLLLEAISQSLVRTGQELHSNAEQIATDLARALLSTLFGSLPALCRQHADPEMRGLIRQIMPGLVRETHLDIRVHPDFVGPVQDELSKLPLDLPKALVVVPDVAMKVTDLRVIWNSGHLVRSSPQIWEEVRQELARFDLLIDPLTSNSEAQNAD
jgi:flagellar assembly protein FliH